jgi:N utilization substance protein B
MTAKRGGADRADQIRALRSGRRLALAAVFEADFGQRTATSVIERHLAEVESHPDASDLARRIVAAVVEHRADIDALIGRIAPQYPVVQLARMDRALLRSAVGEVLHSAATPTRVAIAEWVELARTYSGDPARRLVNGVLGRIAGERPAPGTLARPGRPIRTERPQIDRSVETLGPIAQHVPVSDQTNDTPLTASSSEEGVSGHHVRSAEEDRR